MPTDYKATLNLPQTNFGMKANLAQLEPKTLARWEEIGLYRKILEKNAGGPLFSFHDGPPYANGHIHLGHFLNKILKDLVVKFHNQQGELCDFVPGWDCHGLPIELKVDQELGSKKREMSKVQIRQACRAYAEKWVNTQREEFKRLGVLARWEEPYLTMSYDYEAQTVRELAKFVRAGVVYRGKKPVHWCMQDQTALAEAEVEYEEHESPSIYVAFPSTTDFGKLAPALAGKKVSLLIWTTTPWTLPANLAIAANPDFTYVAYDLQGRVLIIAKELLAKVLLDIAPDELTTKDVKLPGSGESAFSAAVFKDASKILAYLDGKQLEGVKYKHILFDRESPVILGDHVTLEAGSGLVHTAPGHGMDDYIVGLKYGLPILAPVDASGRFTEEAGEWKGQKVLEANPAIIAKLHEKGALLSHPKASFKHQYPCCWRCHKPVIFRATDQWFVSMESRDLRKKCLDEIEKVSWIPKWGHDRIHGMLANRPDWCISRQRTWGVPIPVLYCEAEGCHTEVLDADVMDRVAGFMEKEGADAWYAHDARDFVGDRKCVKCGGTAFRKEQDILDVWFDSGVSYAAVAEKRPNLKVPVDLYLEGSDQHRGWFHSSLMCSVATRGHAPYKSVLTHGFVVDGQGKKMSKSAGNTLEPEKLINMYGAEIIRLWVAATDYREDIRLSDEILKTLTEGYRKIRNTLRYALSNLFDFDPAKDAVPESELLPLDRWALGQLRDLNAKVLDAYRVYEFHTIFHAVLEFCSNTLSATYFDINKDRLYTGKKNGKPRRSAQTVLHTIATDVLRLLAPILSFTADEAWGHLPGSKAESVFVAGVPDGKAAAHNAQEDAELAQLFEVRSAVLGAIEPLRRDKVIGSGLEAKVTLTPTAANRAVLEKWSKELPGIFIVSQVVLASGTADALGVKVERASGEKCPRCWTYEEGLPADGSQVCHKCKEALS